MGETWKKLIKFKGNVLIISSKSPRFQIQNLKDFSVWLDQGTEWNRRFYPGMSALQNAPGHSRA